MRTLQQHEIEQVSGGGPADTMGAVGGALAGGGSGAGIGGAVAGPPGAAVGAVIGAVVGAIAGYVLSKEMGDAHTDLNERGENASG